jgi:hypothetical protein
MIVRVVAAGFLGGLAVFGAAFAGHVTFGWPERQFRSLAGEEKVKDILADTKTAPGIYMFPLFPRPVAKEDRPAAEKAFAEAYRKGPAGLLILHPPGEDPMTGRTLAREFASNVGTCLLAAWVVSLLAPGRSFATRLFVVVAMSLFAWGSIVVSYGIWYQFPWSFVADELFNALLEGVVGGFVIASIVRVRRTVAYPTGGTIGPEAA